MTAISQPALQSEKGVILTIGLLTGQDRWAIVLPVATDDATAQSNPTNACTNAVTAWVNNGLSLLTPCIASDTSIVYVQGEGMVDGHIPFRQDFAPGVEVGSQGTVSLSRNCSVLGVYYVDPSQTLTTGRERVAKNFIAGIDAASVVGDIAQIAVTSAVQTFIDAMAAGFHTASGPPYPTWYRVGKAVRTTGQALPNIVVTAVREYIVTQRRRMIPRN